MLLAIDCGNTNTVFALFDENDKKINAWRMATAAKNTADDYAVWLDHHLQKNNIDRAAIADVVIASVVPDCKRPLMEFAQKHIGAQNPFLIEAGNPAHGVAIDIDTPEQAGADRIANAAAAADYAPPALVVDFGTATTFDMVDGDGAYIGGAIAPGVHLSIAALNEAAAHLPLIDPATWGADTPVHGRNTIAAMNSGLFHGYISLVEGMIAKLEKSYGGKMTVIATGGLAGIFAEMTDRIDHHIPDLTLMGMVKIYRRQNGSKA